MNNHIIYPTFTKTASKNTPLFTQNSTQRNFNTLLAKRFRRFHINHARFQTHQFTPLFYKSRTPSCSFIDLLALQTQTSKHTFKNQHLKPSFNKTKNKTSKQNRNLQSKTKSKLPPKKQKNKPKLKSKSNSFITKNNLQPPVLFKNRFHNLIYLHHLLEGHYLQAFHILTKKRETKNNNKTNQKTSHTFF